ARSRVDCGSGCKRANAEGPRGRRRRLPADGAQVGQASCERRRWRPGRPQLAAAPAVPTDTASHRGADRGATPPAADRQGDRGEVGVSPATVSRVLKRLGLNKLKMLEPAEPVRRYEREHPGELIHIDIKKLGKF